MTIRSRLLRLCVLPLAAGLVSATACGHGQPTPTQMPLQGSTAIVEYRVQADTPTVQAALEKALGEEGFGILFRADMGKAFAKFADKWGDEYNRSGLEEIRAVLFCNPKYANQAANLDPVVLAVCPLSITLLEKSGTTTLLFERPSAVVGDTAAAPTIELVEGKVIAAIETAIAATQPSARNL